MKLNIFNASLESEQELTLKLVKGESGNITLQAVDGNGKAIICGNILNINSNGTVRLHTGISRELGLSLGDDGTINTENFS